MPVSINARLLQLSTIEDVNLSASSKGLSPQLRSLFFLSHSLRAPDHTHLRVAEVDRGSGYVVSKEDDVGLQHAGAAAGRAVGERERSVVGVGKQLGVPVGALLRMLLVATRSAAAAAAAAAAASATFAVIVTNPVFVRVLEPLLHVRSGRERTAVHTSDLYGAVPGKRKIRPLASPVW